MLDYTQLETLDRVVALQSFERAAQALHVTQSAISQRIRALEDHVGQPVLIRGVPLRPSPKGETLLRHFRQVEALEREAFADPELTQTSAWTSIPIALNNDSLYYWFLDALLPFLSEQRVTLKLLLDDEGVTDEALREGRAFAAISSRASAPPGCHSLPLGALRYKAVANPRFYAKHFKTGVNAQSLLKAPFVAFDEKDSLHGEYLQRYFKIKVANQPFFLIPSARGFLTLTQNALAYGLIPDIDADPLLKQKALVEVTPGKDMVRPLYWHSWQTQPALHQKLSECLRRFASKRLVQR